MIIKQKLSENNKIETFQVNLVADPEVLYVINTNFISDTKNRTQEGIPIYVMVFNVGSHKI